MTNRRLALGACGLGRGQFVLLLVAGVFLAGNLSGAGWQELPNTALQSVCPTDNFGGISYPFNAMCHNIIDAWGGAVADTTRNRLIVWGGGHSDYYGNEIYSLNLNVAPPTMTRLNNPSPIADGTCPTALSDGKPNSRHTYNNIAYIQHLDKLFVFGGALACGAGSNKADTWTLDLNTLQWQRMDPVNGPSVPASYSGAPYAQAAYDPNSKSVLLKWGSTLWRYTYETNTYTLLLFDTQVPASATGVIDPVRKLLIFMGLDYNGTSPTVKVINYGGSDYSLQDWSAQVTGCDGIAKANFPGLAYDSNLQQIVGWPNTGNTVYIFNPDTKTCTAQGFTGGPTNGLNSNGSGTFGRFAYFPSLNKYAVVSSATLNAFTLSLSGATPSDTTPPVVSLTSPADGSTVSGVVTVAASATDNVGVASVQFTIDGVNVGGAITAPPYQVSWDTGAAASGNHTITATALDVSGNVGSTTISASVAAVSSQPPPPTSGGSLGAMGLGNSTFKCLDVDGDGFGVGSGCSGADADDFDASIHTGADAITKYGTFAAFLSHRGYTPSRMWFIAPNGSDSSGAVNDSTKPFATYRAVVGQIVPGDAIIWRAGTYSEYIQVMSGSSAKPTIYLAYPGETVTFDMSTGTYTSSSAMDAVNKSWFIIDGFRVGGTRGSQGCINGGTSDGQAASLHHDFTIRYVEGFKDCGLGTTAAFNGIENALVEYGVFHGNSVPNCSTCQHGIYWGSRGLPSKNVTWRRIIAYEDDYNGFHWGGRCIGCTFEQLVAYNNGIAGMSLELGVSNSTIRSSLFFNNVSNELVIYNYSHPDCPTDGICPYDQTGNTFENLTFYHTGYDYTSGSLTNSQFAAAIRVNRDPDVTTTSLGSNTFRNIIAVNYGVNNGYPPIWFSDNNPSTNRCGPDCLNWYATSTFTNIMAWQNDGNNGNNVFFAWDGSGGRYTCAQAASLTKVSNCTSQNPQFVAASPSYWNSVSSFNFRLQSNSPAIGAGTTGSGTYDLLGQTYATPRSLGAIEGGTSSGQTLSCDLNVDGRVDVSDVQNGVNQALGSTQCTNGDLNQNGKCDVADVQRVVTASLGGACKIGP